MQKATLLADVVVKEFCPSELVLFNFLTDFLLKSTALQVSQVRTEGLRVLLDLIVTLLEAADELSKIGNRHLEILPIVALVICQAVRLKSLLKRFRDSPGAVLAHKRVDLRASAVTVHIREIGRHHIVDDSGTEIAR